MLVCHERWWISWTRIHVFYHSLAFSNLIFFRVVLSKSMRISTFRPSSMMSHLLSPCCLSIQLFCYALLVAIFYPKIVQLLLHPVVGMFSCHLPQHVGRIFLRCFGMFCFVSIVCRYLFNLPSFASSFWFIFSSCFVILTWIAFPFLSQHVPVFFFCLIIFACFHGFLTCVSSRISHLGFDFLLVPFKGTPILLLLLLLLLLLYITSIQILAEHNQT